MNDFNAVMHKLSAGETVIGPMISAMRNPEVAWVMAACGFDFFVIDMEHSAISLESVAGLVAAAHGTGVVPMVRPPSRTSDDIPRILDLGARGLLIPRVEEPEDVQRLIETTKYGPVGSRGVALTRGHTFFKKPASPTEYMTQANDGILTAIQIESGSALDNLESLLAVGNIDVAFVGPSDLAQSLGVPGQTSHPLVMAAVKRVCKVCDSLGIVAGTMVHDFASAATYLDYGVRFLIYSNDIGLLTASGVEATSRLRKLSVQALRE